MTSFRKTFSFDYFRLWRNFLVKRHSWRESLASMRYSVVFTTETNRQPTGRGGRDGEITGTIGRADVKERNFISARRYLRWKLTLIGSCLKEKKGTYLTRGTKWLFAKLGGVEFGTTIKKKRTWIIVWFIELSHLRSCSLPFLRYSFNSFTIPRSWMTWQRQFSCTRKYCTLIILMSKPSLA